MHVFIENPIFPEYYFIFDRFWGKMGSTFQEGTDTALYNELLLSIADR
jgi:hypothetical protein